MARTKKVIEEVKEAEVIETPVVEDKPKTTKKKATAKKVEEPVEEQVPDLPAVEEEVKEDTDPVKAYFDKLNSEAAEPPIVFEAVEIVEEKPKKVKKVKAEKVEEPAPAKVEESASGYKAIAVKDLYVLKVPGVLATKLGSYKAGIQFDIIEEDRGWGKIADGKWVNLNYVEKI